MCLDQENGQCVLLTVVGRTGPKQPQSSPGSITSEQLHHFCPVGGPPEWLCTSGHHPFCSLSSSSRQVIPLPSLQSTSVCVADVHTLTPGHPSDVVHPSVSCQSCSSEVSVPAYSSYSKAICPRLLVLLLCLALCILQTMSILPA